MTIALFSDIHANLPALESMFESMDARRPDVVFCLGDLVGYNVWPNEVIRMIRKRGIPTIAGNYDFGVGRTSDDCGCAYKTVEEKAMGVISISFTNAIIGTDERAYLKTLPAHLRIEFENSGKMRTLLLVHGSPRKINEYLFEDREERSLLRLMTEAGADIMCFGHTHKPYHRVLRTETGDDVHAINIGSVGKPKDNDPKGCYVLLKLSDSENWESAVDVEFVRFEYDVERAALGVESSDLPNAYADMLRKGY